MSATVMTYQLVGVPITIGTGLLADYETPLFALSVLGVFLTVGAALVLGHRFVRTSMKAEESTKV